MALRRARDTSFFNFVPLGVASSSKLYLMVTMAVPAPAMKATFPRTGRSEGRRSCSQPFASYINQLYSGTIWGWKFDQEI